MVKELVRVATGVRAAFEGNLEHFEYTRDEAVVLFTRYKTAVEAHERRKGRFGQERRPRGDEIMILLLKAVNRLADVFESGLETGPDVSFSSGTHALTC